MTTKFKLFLSVLIMSIFFFTSCGDDSSSENDDNNSGTGDNDIAEATDNEKEDDTEEPDGSDASEQDDKDTSESTCETEDATRCDGNILQVCKNGKWEDDTDCENDGMGGFICSEENGKAECVAPTEEEVLNDDVNTGTIEADGDNWWINASSGGMSEAEQHSWLYIKLNDKFEPEKTEISDKEAKESSVWHIALRRNYIKLNGGCFGAGDVGLKTNEGADFDHILHYLESGYAKEDYLDKDGNVITDQIGGPATLLSEWYDLDMDTMGLTPKNEIYILSLGDGRYAKMEILDYYRTVDDGSAGDVTISAWYSMKFGSIDNKITKTEGTTTVDASAGGMMGSGSNPPAFYSFATDSVVAGYPTETGDSTFKPENNWEWDMWLKRTSIGISDAPGSAMINTASTDFETASIPTEHPYMENEDLIAAYAGYTPILEEKGTYVLTAADGKTETLYKFMTTEATYVASTQGMGGTWTSIRFKHKKVDEGDSVNPVEHTAELSTEDMVVYYSFADGLVIGVSDETTDTTWDVKFSQNGILYNSGSNLSGSGAGSYVGQDMFDEIDGTENLYWVRESGDIPSFLGWYSMQGMGSLNSNGYIYIVRTAEGYPVAVEFTDYYKEVEGEDVSGYITFSWKYL